jgi:hypothetical protein
MRFMLLFEDPGNFDGAYVANAMAGSGWPVEEMRKDFIDFESEHGPIFEEGSTPMLKVMIEHAKEVPFDRLCDARDAFLGAGCANMMLVICSAIAPSARQFLVALRQSDAGKLFADINYYPNNPQHLVAGTLQTSMDKDYLEAMAGYGQELTMQLLPFMVETQARAVVKTEPEEVADMGMGLFRVAVHARLNHDDPNWHTPDFRESMLELIALMKGVDIDQADPNNMVARLWADISEEDLADA